MIRGVEEYIKMNNLKHSLLLSDISNINESINPYIETFLSNRVAGILSTSENIDKEYMNYLREINIPIVFLDCYRKKKEFTFSYVTINDYKGAYDITEYLIKNGHKKINFISSDIDSSFTWDRNKGFKAAMKKNNITINEDNILFCRNIGITDGFKSAEIILSSKNKPTAIICINDEVAYGVIDYCYKNKIRIPDDISITGFDDNSYSSLSFIDLTTVRDPVKEIGQIGAAILFDKIITKNGEQIIKIVEPEIMVRNSVKSLI